MKAKAMVDIDIDNIRAFCFGLGGGVIKILLDSPLLLDSYWLALAKAGITAFVCGFIGVAGKYAFSYLKTWYKSKFKK